MRSCEIIQSDWLKTSCDFIGCYHWPCNVFGADEFKL